MNDTTCLEQRYQSLLKYVRDSPSVRRAFSYGVQHALDKTHHSAPDPQTNDEIREEAIAFLHNLSDRLKREIIK